MGKCLAYIITEGGKDYLCVLDDERSKFDRFEIGPEVMCRLVVECGERVLKAFPNTYARRINAEPIKGD